MSVVGPPEGGVRWQDLDDRIVAFNPVTGRAAALNETASQIWNLADGTRTEGEIVGQLAQAYGVPPDSIAAGILAAIEQLRAEGLLPKGQGE